MLCPACTPKDKRSLFTDTGGRGRNLQAVGTLHTHQVPCSLHFQLRLHSCRGELEGQCFAFYLLKKCKRMVSKGVGRSSKLYQMKGKDASIKKHTKALVQSSSHRLIRRGNKSVFICHKYCFAWGAQAHTQEACCSWMLFMKCRIVDGSLKFLRVSSRKLLSWMTEWFCSIAAL